MDFLRKINVILVESPLQVLSAIEAAEHFGYRNVNLIVRYADPLSRERNNDHINAALAQYNFDTVRPISVTKSKLRNKLRIYGLYLWLRINRWRISNIAIGEWRSEWMQRCADIAKKETVVLLDDGIIVVDILQNKIEKGVGWDFSGEKPKRLRRQIDLAILKLLGSEGKHKWDWHIYTAFFAGADSQTTLITKNNYDFLKGKIATLKNDGIYYFGTKYSEAGYFPLQVELHFLENVFKTLSDLYKEASSEHDNPILYIPHRDDSEQKIAAVKEIGFEVKFLPYPAEIYFTNTQIRPKVIAGAFTTAVANVSAIYEPQIIHLFKLPIEQIAYEKREHVKSIYTFYESQGFKVINPNI